MVGGSQSIHCLPAIDVTNYSTVSITVDSKTNASSIYFAMSPSGSNCESGSAIKSQNITGTGTYTIDISKCTGNWIFAFRCIEASSGSAIISAIDFY